jgi:hypothetical protein
MVQSREALVYIWGGVIWVAALDWLALNFGSWEMVGGEGELTDAKREHVEITTRKK